VPIHKRNKGTIDCPIQKKAIFLQDQGFREPAAAINRPSKCIGTHFLIPAALTPLVEVVRGTETSDDTHDSVIGFLTKCGKGTGQGGDHNR
jgi:3-hydroxyacyl-CoA dehydrogenase